jgi:DNA-binding MarR family transcriptional regulator
MRHGNYGLTPSQISTLTTLDRHRQLRLGDLARREQVGKSSMTQRIAKLEDAGYVARTVDPDDRRCYLIELTPSGARILEEASARQDDYLTRQIAALSPGDHEVLNGSVRVLETLLDLKA